MKDMDSGMVIYNKKNNVYYCGMNTWDKQLRKAKVYHVKRYVKDDIDKIVTEDTRDIFKRTYSLEDIEVYNIEVKVTDKVDI